MKSKLPKKKKNIKAFLSEEEGRITKQKILKFGLMVIGSAAALSSLMKADSTLAGSAHTSHGSHGSHGSHASHGSHDSHGSHGQW